MLVFRGVTPSTYKWRRCLLCLNTTRSLHVKTFAPIAIDIGQSQEQSRLDNDVFLRRTADLNNKNIPPKMQTI